MAADLKVQPYGAATAGGDVGGTAASLALAVDADHVGAQVGQQHAAEGARANSRKLDNLEAGQGSLAHVSLPRMSTPTLPP